MDSKDLSEEIFKLNKEMYENVVFERSKLIFLRSVRRILNENQDLLIKEFFGMKNWQSNFPFIFSTTFYFNPFDEFTKIDELSGYFDYQYNFSDPLILIPNIKIDKYDERTRKKIQIIKIEDYLRYIIDAYNIFDYKNKKPIFVPLSLRLGMNEIKKIAQEYIKKDFFYIWVDFEGSTLTKPKIARIRTFLREFEVKGIMDKTVIYSTNIKREIISNIKEEQSPSSDVLLSLIGANIIGVNREPPRIIKAPPLTPQELFNLRLHKARVFVPETYYYLKVINSNYNRNQKQRLLNQPFNVSFNSTLLDQEYENQAKYFLENLKILYYITSKPMIKEFREGLLQKSLFEPQTKISKWF